MSARRWVPRSLVALLAAVVAASPAAATGPAASSPTTTASVAASSAEGIVLTGRGYGHGRGMSQYGAKGRAEAGHGYATILANYYPGTTLTTQSDSRAVTVWITRDTDNQVWFLPEPGLSLRGSNPDVADDVPSAVVPLPATVPGPGGVASAPTMWRLRLVSYTFVLEGRVGSTWYPHGSAAITAALSNKKRVGVSATDGTVRLVTGSSYREYRGTLEANRPAGTTTVRTTVTTTMREYLRSVVPSEMPASWNIEAVKAQAVAARTYATQEIAAASRPWWYDTCDTTQCQVFHGVSEHTSAGAVSRSYEHPRGTLAVDATAGQVLTYGGQAAFTQFSASNGGYSLGGSQAYLPAKADPYDAYPQWTVTLTAAQLQAKYPQIGTFRSISATRDGRGAYGGRTVTVTITGSAGTAQRTGDQFRSDFGLRSTMWTSSALEPPRLPALPPLYNPQRDWNGDRLHDLIGRAPDGTLYLYAGRGPAQWWARQQIGKGWQVMGLMTQVHGFSGTEKPEIITTDPRSGELRLYPGDGRGGFTAPRTIGRGWSGFDTLVGVEGWHAPGAPGLVARDGQGRLWFYPGDGKGRFGATRQIGHGWQGMDVIAFAGDLDGDGRPDLIARHATTKALWLYRGDGRGGILASRQIGQGWGAMDMVLSGADWDRDGRVDVLARIASSGDLLLYPGNGKGGFQASRKVGNGWLGFVLVS